MRRSSRAGCCLRACAGRSRRASSTAATGDLPANILRVCCATFEQQAGVGRYATFAALAGEDPTDHAAASAGLPPVDGEAATLS